MLSTPLIDGEPSAIELIKTSGGLLTRICEFRVFPEVSFEPKTSFAQSMHAHWSNRIELSDLVNVDSHFCSRPSIESLFGQHDLKHIS